LIRELAEQLRVTEDMVINWEKKRRRKPATRHNQRVRLEINRLWDIAMR
jgi:DNA-binding transcriptional regulator YiaG